MLMLFEPEGGNQLEIHLYAPDNDKGPLFSGPFHFVYVVSAYAATTLTTFLLPAFLLNCTTPSITAKMV